MPQTSDVFKSTEKVHMIREEKQKNGKIRLIEAWLPVGRGYSRGNSGSLDWENKKIGWQSYDAYMAEQNSKQAAAKRDEEIAKGEAKKEKAK